MKITVGISEMAVSAEPGETLITYSLGSCVGLSLYDTAAPIVVISTEGSAVRIQDLKDKGVNAFLRKPFQPEALKKTVEEVLGVGNG